MPRSASTIASALVCLGLLAVAGCGSDDDTASPVTEPPTTTAAPPTSAVDVTTTSVAPPTTVASPTTVATPTTAAPPTTAGPTTTTPGISSGFDPACVEQPADGSPSDTSWDDELATFGPLGVTPAITVNLPVGHGAGSVVDATSTWVERVPGGFLLAVTASSHAQFDGTILAVIDHDGSTRWVRCLDERATVYASATAGEAFVSSIPLGAVAPATPTWQVISLVDGATTGSIADVAAGAGVPEHVAALDRPLAWTRSVLLLGPGDDHVIDESADRLLMIDLGTATAAAIAYPPGSDGRRGFELELDATDDEHVVVTARMAADMPPAARAVLVDGEWSTDLADLGAARPLVLDFQEGGASTIRALDASNEVIWARDDIGGFGGEGFRYAVDGEVVVVAGCTPSGRGPEDPCADEGALFGLDRATGETVWQLHGRRGVGPLAGGFALVTSPDDQSNGAPGSTVWTMIDTADGEPVDGQRWPEPYSFGTGCCGGEQTSHTDRLDGAVAAVHGTQAFIWFPAALTPRIPAVAAVP